MSLTQKGLAVLAIPLLVQLGIVCYYAGFLERIEHLNANEYQNKEVIGRINWISTLILAAASSATANAVTADNNYAQIYAEYKKAADQELSALSKMPNEGAAQSKQVKATIQEWHSLEALLDEANAQSPEKLAQVLKDPKTKNLWQQLSEHRSQYLAEQLQRFPVTPADVLMRRNIRKNLLYADVILNVFIALILFFIFSQGIIRRLAIVASNSVRLANRQELVAVMSGRDEISLLDQNFHSMADDLTAARLTLEASEQNIRNIINNLPVGVLLLDRDSNVAFANAKAANMFKIVAVDLNGRAIDDLLTDRLKQRSVTALLDEKPAGVMELQATTVDQQTFPVEISCNKINLAEKEMTLLAIADISERHEIDAMKKNFIAMVCHDLRNPLTTIRLFQQLLETQIWGELSEAGVKFLHNAQRCSDRLLSLVNDMLDVEKIEAGQLPLVITQVAVQTLLEQAAATVEGFARPKNIPIQWQSVQCACDMDEQRILRVLVNLLSNAVKFSPKNMPVEIEVETSETTITMKIVDHGRGIPPEFLATVFDKFKQVKMQDARAGTGLGLSICKTFVEEHGGQIGVTSTVDMGSTFWFTLPLSQNHGATG